MRRVNAVRAPASKHGPMFPVVGDLDRDERPGGDATRLPQDVEPTENRQPVLDEQHVGLFRDDDPHGVRAVRQLTGELHPAGARVGPDLVLERVADLRAEKGKT